MQFSALASDYDGTLTANGRVRAGVLEALQRARNSGWKLILVTGRELSPLLAVFPGVGVFDRVVAENGALLYHPGTGEQRPLGPAPSEELVAGLKRRGVVVSVGQCVVATLTTREAAVRETIREMGLDLQVIHNKESIMILPRGIDKSTGLRAVLTELQLDPSQVVGIGDAENDFAFLGECGLSVAVSNAIPQLKQQVQVVTKGEYGNGVVEVLNRLLAHGGPERISRTT